jgi:hypothetical protein
MKLHVPEIIYKTWYEATFTVFIGGDVERAVDVNFDVSEFKVTLLVPPIVRVLGLCLQTTLKNNKHTDPKHQPTFKH